MAASPRARLLTVIFVAAAMVFVGCGSSGGEDATDTTTAGATDTTAAGATTTTAAAKGDGDGDVTETCAAMKDLEALTETEQSDDLDERRDQVRALRDLVERASNAAPDEVADDFKALLGYFDDALDASKDAKTIDEFDEAAGSVDASSYEDSGKAVDTWQKANC